MTRRSFLTTVAAVAAAPFVPAPVPSAVRAEQRPLIFLTHEWFYRLMAGRVVPGISPAKAAMVRTAVTELADLAYPSHRDPDVWYDIRLDGYWVRP